MCVCLLPVPLRSEAVPLRSHFCASLLLKWLEKQVKLFDSLLLVNLKLGNQKLYYIS